MFPDHLSLHLLGIDVEMLRQMHTETQAIEESAGAQHAIILRACACDIDESTSTANLSRTNDSDFHDLTRMRKTVDRRAGQLGMHYRLIAHSMPVHCTSPPVALHRWCRLPQVPGLAKRRSADIARKHDAIPIVRREVLRL